MCQPPVHVTLSEYNNLFLYTFVNIGHNKTKCDKKMMKNKNYSFLLENTLSFHFQKNNKIMGQFL